MLKMIAGFITIVLIGHRINAQTTDFTISINDRHNQLNLDYLPFNKVFVLDNRIDKTQIYAVEDGSYPLKKVNFDLPVNIEFEQFIGSCLHQMPTGTDSLLINIKQLSVGNKMGFFKNKYNSGTKHRYYNIRGRLLFSADLYKKKGNGRFQKIGAINKFYPVVSSLKNVVILALNNLMEFSSIADGFPDSLSTRPISKKIEYFLKDSGSFILTKGFDSQYFNQINKSVQNGWKDYSIVNSKQRDVGFYNDFNDFQNNVVKKTNFQMAFNEMDSSYSIKNINGLAFGKFKANPWAVCDSLGNVYVNVWMNKFLKISPYQNTFYFHVPSTLPNMYAIFSLSEVDDGNSQPNSNNILADIVGIMSKGIVSAAVVADERKKIATDGKNQNFRNCIINMDNGDFIYDLLF